MVIKIWIFIAGQTTCQQCPAGSACPNGQTPVTCNAGFFSVLGQGDCTPCSPGTYAATTGNHVR